MTAAPPLPLDGIRVLELGSSVAIPYGTWVLGMLGAEVVKVERPGPGDNARNWGMSYGEGLMRSIFVALNCAKKSITVDLESEAERDRLRRLIVETTDVVVQNMRPGLVERFGLSGPDLMPQAPRLIYINGGAYGATGPFKDRPGYDPLMQAMSGIMGTTGEPGRPPVRVSASLVDMGTGMWCVIAALMGLYRRALTNKGGSFDTSLYETVVGWMNYQTAHYLANGQELEKFGTRSPGIAPYEAFECADGWLVIAAPSDTLFRRVCAVLGHPEWAEDPRFETNALRWQNLEALNALLQPAVRQETRAHWSEKLVAAGVPNGPIHSLGEMVAHPQTQALGLIEETPDQLYRLVGLPLSIDGMRPPVTASPPEVGAHNDEIFKDFPLE